MSDDEMVFEEVAYREPHRARRPDLDPGLACIAYRVPAPDDLPIYLEKAPADAIERHALQDTSVELGGILLGRECLDEATGTPFVWITEALEAKHYENTQASFTYTHDSWEEITRERDAKFPDLDIVGWYHTHPDFGIFLSSHDLFIHHNFFDQPLQVAYVVDPIRQDRGFFRWRDGKMVQVGGFHLTAPRAERASLAKLVNDLEGYPDAGGGGGGGGISPRLEAELIAMLSRPHTVAVAADRSQSAATFTMLGILLASLVFVAGYWLQTLGRGLSEQTRAIEALAEAQKKAAVATESAIVTERVAAKESTLDSLLGELKIDPAAPKLTAKISEVLAQRDEARKAISKLQTEKEALAEHASTLSERNRALALEVSADRQKEATRAKEDTEDIRKLTERVEKLTADMADKDKLVSDNVNGTLLRKYTWSFWLAVLGWGVAAACAVALGTAYTRPPELGGRDEPPHTIT